MISYSLCMSYVFARRNAVLASHSVSHQQSGVLARVCLYIPLVFSRSASPCIFFSSVRSSVQRNIRIAAISRHGTRAFCVHGAFFITPVCNRRHSSKVSPHLKGFPRLKVFRHPKAFSRLFIIPHSMVFASVDFSTSKHLSEDIFALLHPKIRDSCRILPKISCVWGS